jgi:hypothetical protein
MVSQGVPEAITLGKSYCSQVHRNIHFIQLFVAKILLIGLGFCVPFGSGAGVRSGAIRIALKTFRFC